eukprot:Lithocolla_globosa_v1_NODE_53_length_7694_cov_9.633984.p3 type:complete len:376 gc:universal NODE_53_length_7694_cov_9.633984:6012-7139(+)
MMIVVRWICDDNKKRSGTKYGDSGNPATILNLICADEIPECNFASTIRYLQENCDKCSNFRGEEAFNKMVLPGQDDSSTLQDEIAALSIGFIFPLSCQYLYCDGFVHSLKVAQWGGLIAKEQTQGPPSIIVNAVTYGLIGMIARTPGHYSAQFVEVGTGNLRFYDGYKDYCADQTPHLRSPNSWESMADKDNIWLYAAKLEVSADKVNSTLFRDWSIQLELPMEVRGLPDLKKTQPQRKRKEVRQDGGKHKKPTIVVAEKNVDTRDYSKSGCHKFNKRVGNNNARDMSSNNAKNDDEQREYEHIIILCECKSSTTEKTADMIQSLVPGGKRQFEEVSLEYAQHKICEEATSDDFAGISSELAKVRDKQSLRPLDI